tara:strand:+ start:23365 stop:24552 length:1188 start_codon:yes stop_codon:yes gene_type:complete
MADDEIRVEPISEQDFKEQKAEVEKYAQNVITDEIDKQLKARIPEQRLPMADDTPKTNEGSFKTFGEYIKAIDDKNKGKNDDIRLKALGESSGETGGFLVPDEFRSELLRIPMEDAIIRPRARIIPMASNTIKLPRVKDTSHASSVHGGVVGYWTEEAGSYTASEPDFAQFQLVAKKLTGYTQASNELVQDSAIALESLLTGMFGDAIRFYEENSFINGDGAGEPIGIKNSDALISVAKETGQAATTIVYENLVNMYSRMIPSSHKNAVWIAHPDVMPQLMTMALNVGTGGSAIFVNNASAEVPMSIFGRPIFFTEHAQTLGTVGDIYYADLSYYVIGDRQGITIASSDHYRFANGETVWRFTERLDGAPWLDSAITPQHGSKTISPFVALATRS